MITLFFKLFEVFFKIGILGFGGDYALISMIQGETVVQQEWLTMGQFTDIVAISQMAPGPLSVNTATYVAYNCMINAGYEWYWGIVGSLCALVGLILPCFILLLIISRIVVNIKNSSTMDQMYRGLQPAIVGLVAATALCMMSQDNFSTPSVCPWQFWISIGLYVFAFIAQKVYKMNPILILALCGTAGYLLL